MSKLRSELEFIRGIATNLIRDVDEMEAAFSKSQRTRTTERKMESVRERARLLITCAEDAIKAEEQPQ